MQAETASGDKLVTTGDIPAWLVSLSDNPNHNMVTQSNVDYTGELSFGFSLALAAEGGVKWRLTEQWSLYTGVYVDYGVLNVAPSASGALDVGALLSELGSWDFGHS
ncbi:MAG: hypothetical protein LBS63_03120 [Prevotellaceae bacterium]|nr:hypothetical protein [Prevotellaceae bacterium]